MTTTTPAREIPAAFDRHALEIARGIAHLKLDAMAYEKRVEILRAALVESMQLAAEDAFKRGYAQRDAEVMGALV